MDGRTDQPDASDGPPEDAARQRGPGCGAGREAGCEAGCGLDAASARRIVVVGTSGAGKTTTARRLADALGHPHVELDALHWLPEWTEREPDELIALVEREIARDAWVIDGNYGAVRDAIWARATAIVWVDPPFATVLARVTRRSLRRALRREVLWSGNRESLSRSFASRDSVILWAATTFHRRRAQYGERFERPRAAGDDRRFVRCRTRREVEALVEACERLRHT